MLRVYNSRALYRHQRFLKALVISMPPAIMMILIITLLQSIFPFTFSFYYIFVGMILGKIIQKTGRGVQVHFSILAATLTLFIFYFADVSTIMIVFKLEWENINQYEPSVWLAALRLWGLGTTNIWNLLSFLFRIAGIYYAWDYARIK